MTCLLFVEKYGVSLIKRGHYLYAFSILGLHKFDISGPDGGAVAVEPKPGTALRSSFASIETKTSPPVEGSAKSTVSDFVKFKFVDDKNNPIAHRDLKFRSGTNRYRATRTNGNGELSILRSQFYKNGNSLDKVVFFTPQGEQNDVYFTHRMTLPNYLFERIDFEVPLFPLELNFTYNRPQSFYKDKKMTIVFSQNLSHPGSAKNDKRTLFIRKVDCVNQVIIPNLSPNSYSFKIRVPGSLEWITRKVLLKGQKMMQVHFEPAVNLFVKVILPNGKETRNSSYFLLLKYQKERDRWNPIYKQYRGDIRQYSDLTYGDYIFKVYSSREVNNMLKKRGRPLIKSVAFDGLEKRIKIVSVHCYYLQIV